MFNNFCRYLFTFSDLLFKLCLTLKVESMTKVSLTFKMGDSHLNPWKVLKIVFIIGLLVRLSPETTSYLNKIARWHSCCWYCCPACLGSCLTRWWWWAGLGQTLTPLLPSPSVPTTRASKSSESDLARAGSTHARNIVAPGGEEMHGNWNSSRNSVTRRK